VTALLRRLLLLWLAAFAFAQGCSAAAVEERSPVGVPSAVFQALCTAFVEAEEFDSSTTTVVLNETRAVFETFALRVLHEAGELTPAESEQDLARDQDLKASFLSARVDLPEAGGPCRWRLADRPAQEYFGTRALILELSNVLEDPFAPVDGPRHGLFARLSIGGASGASWYWVALKKVGTLWEVAAVSHLEISDG